MAAKFGLVVIAAGLLVPAAARGGAPRADCFPVERLPAALQPRANTLLLKLLDSEALYTVAGGLKPVSDGFWTARFPADRPPPPTVDEARTILAAFRCGDDLTAGVLVFASAFDGQRAATAFVAHRPAVRGVVLRHPGVFGPLGVTILTDPQEVLEAVDRADPATRWRAFGLLFGYPENAVDFFVRAGVEEKRTGVFVPRDFRHVPTFGGERGRFVYAVPKGVPESDADRALKARAGPILDEYRRRRPLDVGDGKPGPAALVRGWLDDGSGWCAAGNADPNHLRPAAVVRQVVVPGHRPGLYGRPRFHRVRSEGCGCSGR